VSEILKSYAYEGYGREGTRKNYPFLTVLAELSGSDASKNVQGYAQ
jgi:hypothetical protein